jgi:hypothetical protein
MDPFLELPDMFPGLHISLITHLMGTLQRALPAPYYAKSGERIFLTAPRREIIPDVDVRRHLPKARNGHFETNWGAATTVLQRPPVRISVPSVEVTEPFLDVFLKRPKGARLVTTIEILSPTNKANGGQGRKKYLSKQKDVLRQRVHLVEIEQAVALHSRRVLAAAK